MRLSVRAGAVVFLTLAVACSSSSNGSATDAGHPTDAAKSPPDVADGCSEPQVCCQIALDECEMELGTATCSTGRWSCPGGGFVEPACSGACMETPSDGASACQPASVTVCCGTVNGCSMSLGTPDCTQLGWSCPSGGTPSVSCSAICTGTNPDSGADAGAGSFACGSASCNPETQYCAITVGGAVQPDGSTNMLASCQPWPSSCATPSCSCFPATDTCTDQNGDITDTTDAP